MAKDSLSIFDDDEPQPRRAGDAAETSAATTAPSARRAAPTGETLPGSAAESAPTAQPRTEPAEAHAVPADHDDPTDPTHPIDPPEEPKKKRRSVLFFSLATLGVLVGGGAGVVGYYATQLTRSVNQMQRQRDVMPDGVRPPSASAAPKAEHPPLNIVIMGSDSRGAGDRGRSDSLMVLHIAGDRKNAYFVSFPRDMWVEIPGRGRAKINAAYAYGGPALSVQVLEQITGTRMDHVALTNFDNFIKLVDVVGGVTINNRIATSMKAESGRIYTYPVGEITLSGEGALLYCRERYDLPNGDFDRAGRQRDVLKALLLKSASPEILANPVKVTELVSAVGKYVTVDAAMTTSVMLSYAAQMRLSGADSIKTLQAPLVGSSTSTDGQWIAVYDPAAVATLGKALREDTMATYYEGHKYDHAKPLPPVPSPK